MHEKEIVSLFRLHLQFNARIVPGKYSDDALEYAEQYLCGYETEAARHIADYVYKRLGLAGSALLFPLGDE